MELDEKSLEWIKLIEKEHEIDEETMSEIVDSVTKKYKLKDWRKQQFRNTIYLGCSPKTKVN